MNNHYPAAWQHLVDKLITWRGVCLLVLACLLLSPVAQAQSGPYGNEWIVPGQPYYKMKVWRDGLYRLDYAYLSKLSGITGVAPTQLQLWRRGKEVAVYQGGSSATLDNTTYLEFYGQRNDGVLDRDLYKKPADQSHTFFSFYTDTAAYFITWSAGRLGKRMAQPVAAGGAPHAWRIQSVLKVYTSFYLDAPNTDYYTCLPWLERGEGFYSPTYFDNVTTNDSLLRAVVTAPTAPRPVAEVLVLGGSISSKSNGLHTTSVGVIPANGSYSDYRQQAVLTYQNFDFARTRFTLQAGDISSTGQVKVYAFAVGTPSGPVYDIFRFGYLRLTAPQENRWFSDRRQLLFKNDSLLGGPATYEIDNIPATVTGYDIQDPWNVQRIAPGTAQTMGNTARRFVFPSATTAQTRQLLLADAALPLIPAAPIRVQFRVINAAKPNFVIITHPKLMQPVGAEPNAARAYANYRASAVGGGYDTLMVTAPQLYDQFHYGERSLLALRHFALWLNAATPTQTKYLLLLGDGLAPNSYIGINTYPATDKGLSADKTTRILGDLGRDLVPTSTRAPSDNLLSSDWQHDDYVAKLPTGRVVALSPQQVIDYLNKLKEHEALGPEGWRKNALHLVGGHNDGDFQEFAGYLNKYKQTIERPLLGGQVKTYAKTGGLLPVSINISTDLNNGLSLISYFGHGSTTLMDLDIGSINDPLNDYHNAGRYPVLMYDGCDAGACFMSAPVFSTDWLLAPNKGAIGVLAETDFSYAYLLDPVQLQLHKLLFNNPAWFGRPVAEVYGEVVRRLQTTAPFRNGTSGIVNPAGAVDLLATLWQGDPALRLYAPAKPDFVANGVSMTPAKVAATATSFQLNIPVSNPARITFDSVEVRITRSYASQSGAAARKPDVILRTFRQAWQRDTTYTVTIPNSGNVFGTNKLLVELDYRNKVAELNENNNSAELSYTFLQGGVTQLTPTEFAIVASPTPRLVAQSNDLASPTRGYDFQVDSVATFDSRALQSRPSLQAAAVASWTPAALLPAAGRDSVVWYWRVRLTTPSAQEDGTWQVSSFRVITKALTGGWSQSHNGQFNRDQLQSVAVSTPGNRWKFADQQQALQLRTVGGGGVGSSATFNTTSGYGIFTDASQPPFVAGCGINSPNLLVVVFDEHTLKRLAITQGGPYLTCGQGSQTFYHFGNDADSTDNLNNSTTRQTQLKTFLSNVPDGAYVALISENRLRYASFLPVLGNSFSALLGSKLITQLKNGDPWALVAQKRASGGRLIQEVGPDRSLTQASFSQSVSLSTALTIPGQAGSVTSTLIGPAQKWQTLYNTIRRETATSSYTLVLSGVDATGKATVLNPNVGHQPVDLSAYSTATYPYMQLQLALRDSVNRTPPQLKQWLITYKGLPEGIVRRDLVATAVYDTTRIKNQALNSGVISFPVKFDNVSQEAFASRLQVQVQLINVATGLPVASSTKLLTAPRDLGANDSVLTVNVSLNVKGLFGRFMPRVFVNPQLQPELYYYNNELVLNAFTISDSSVPPTLDVAVDGRHILDGELVSPTPVISIQLKDSDKVRHITKASNLTLFLQGPGQATATAIDVNGPLVHFSVDSTAGSVARLEFNPAKLTDGVYTLRVQGRNAANASAAIQDFQVKFEVVNASTITNVFPYPNPVTSKARFVFTVTGQELPRNMKIQIMTLTGRVVREIFMSELGPLHIGNNITDYAWDGTDQYGDRLANGTYLYRVSLDQSGSTFTQRATAGDQAFKNDWGKLVLLR